MKTIPEQRQLEFQKLENLAAEYLEFPHSIPKANNIKRWRFLLRIWHYPSFTESRSWGLYQQHVRGSRQALSMVRQITWDRPSDANRLLDPLTGLEHGFHTYPKIEVRDRPVDTTQLDDRRRKLAEITFPAFGALGFGIDGETFGIEDPGSKTKAEWWCNGPDSWSELTSWTSNFRDWLCSITSVEPEYELWKKPRPRLP